MSTVLSYEKMVKNFMEYEKCMDNVFHGETSVRHLPAMLKLKRGKEEVSIGLSSKTFNPNNTAKCIYGKNITTDEIIDIDKFMIVPDGEEAWNVQAEISGDVLNLLKKSASLTDFSEYKNKIETEFSEEVRAFLGKVVPNSQITDEDNNTVSEKFAHILSDPEIAVSADMCRPRYYCDEAMELFPCYLIPAQCCKEECPYKIFIK